MTLWCSKSPFLYKKPDIITSSAATLTLGPEIGAHNWNTHKSTPNKHIKQEWCETIGKYLIKWLKTWIIIYLGAQYDLEIGPLGPIFNTPLKLARIDMYTKTDAKLVEIFLENDQKTGILTYLGDLSEAHILHTYESTWNEHVKEYGCETSENFLRKWPNTRNLSYSGAKMAQKLAFKRHISFYTSLTDSDSSSNAHIKQDWRESRANFLTKYSKTWILTPLEAQNGPKIWASLLHSYKSSSNVLVNQVSSEYSRNVSRK